MRGLCAPAFLLCAGLCAGLCALRCSRGVAFYLALLQRLCRSVASSSIRCFFVHSKYAHCDRRSAYGLRAFWGCGPKAPTGQGRACADYARTMRGGVWHAVDHLDRNLLCRSAASLSIRCFFINPLIPSHQTGQGRACADYARRDPWPSAHNPAHNVAHNKNAGAHNPRIM